MRINNIYLNVLTFDSSGIWHRINLHLLLQRLNVKYQFHISFLVNDALESSKTLMLGIRSGINQEFKTPKPPLSISSSQL